MSRVLLRCALAATMLGVLVCLGLVLPRVRAEGEAGGPCKHAWYTQCLCPGGAACCGCAGCTPGSGCPCATRPASGRGAVRGVLKSPYVKRWPAVVYLEDAPGAGVLPPRNPVMDQVNLIFTPRILPVVVGSTVDFPNNDKVRHSVYTTPTSPVAFNLGSYPAGEKRQVKFDKIGAAVLLCNVHAEMVGYVVVCPNPYFTLTPKGQDTFLIPNVPPGRYQLTFYHEKLAPVRLPVEVRAGAETEVEFAKLEKR